jgi:hypothetical protein
MDFLFNELSIVPAHTNPAPARSMMDGLVQTVAAGVSRRILSSVKTDSGFMGRALATGYSIADWLNDAQVDREAKRLVMTVAAKAPYADSMLSELQVTKLAEFKIEGLQAIGCGVAVLTDQPALSAAREPWKTDPIAVVATYVSEMGTDEVPELVCNLYSEACFDRRVDFLEERARRRIAKGADVVADQDGLFRLLVFGPTARHQLEQLRGTEPEFGSVVRHLCALSRRAAEWTGGTFEDGFPFKCSPESEATMAKYGAQRIFPIAGGSFRQFTWHSKVNIGARRIYFHAERPGAPVVVGYVGKHLDIVSN